jgi:hypothetical protein
MPIFLLCSYFKTLFASLIAYKTILLGSEIDLVRVDDHLEKCYCHSLPETGGIVSAYPSSCSQLKADIHPERFTRRSEPVSRYYRPVSESSSFLSLDRNAEDDLRYTTTSAIQQTGCANDCAVLAEQKP